MELIDQSFAHDVAASAWHAWRWVSGVGKIVCGFALATHKVVKAAPERTDSFIFLRHAVDFLEFAVEDIDRGKQDLKAAGDFLGEADPLLVEECGFGGFIVGHGEEP